VHQLRWVNVSPAGDKVIYSALGHLYIRDLPNGTPRRLTKQTENFEYFPSFSRDGKSVVYTTWNDQKLGTVKVLDIASGKETLITKAPGKYVQARFSPDGKQVVFVKAKGGYLTTPWYAVETGVYIANADGKSAPVLVTEDGSAPQFGKDSSAVYVSRTKYTGEVDWTTSLVRAFG
jgi:Tol biopolymer transport system component